MKYKRNEPPAARRIAPLGAQKRSTRIGDTLARERIHRPAKHVFPFRRTGCRLQAGPPDSVRNEGVPGRDVVAVVNRRRRPLVHNLTIAIYVDCLFRAHATRFYRWSNRESHLRSSHSHRLSPPVVYLLKQTLA